MAVVIRTRVAALTVGDSIWSSIVSSTAIALRLEQPQRGGCEVKEQMLWRCRQRAASSLDLRGHERPDRWPRFSTHPAGTAAVPDGRALRSELRCASVGLTLAGGEARLLAPARLLLSSDSATA